MVTTSHHDGETFAFAGPAGSTGAATWSGGNQGTPESATASDTNQGTPESATASVTPPPMPSGGMDLTATQAAQLVYEEAVAVGTPVAAAQQMAFGSSVTISSTSNVTGSNGTETTGATTTPASISKGTIFNSTCDHVTIDSGAAWGTSCLVQRMAQDTEPDDVYVEDEITTSGNDPSGLILLAGTDYYRYPGSSGEHGIVQWDPSATKDVGNPQKWTVGISYDGIGVSVSQTVYPDEITPVLQQYNGDYPTSVGSYWTGDEGGNTVLGSPAVDLAHIWDSGSIDAGSSVEIGGW